MISGNEKPDSGIFSETVSNFFAIDCWIPFLLSLFTGKYAIELPAIAEATIIAITSNNVLKLIYAIWFGEKKIRKPLILSFGIIILVGIIFVLILM